MNNDNDDVLKAFINRQRELLSRERDAEIERSSLLLTNCGPKLLEQKGLALGGLGVVGMNLGLGGKTLVELERPTAYHSTPIFPPHTFRPGDLARVEANAPAKTAKKAATAVADTKSPQVEGVVYKVSDTRIVIAVDSSDSTSQDLELPERCRVVKLANNITYDRMDKAIDQLEQTLGLSTVDSKPSQFTPLVRVLMGIQPPSNPATLPPIKFFDDNLNPSQQAAVRFALGAPEVACIHGPPGTGKTHTLIEIIRQLTAPLPTPTTTTTTSDSDASSNTKTDLKPQRVLVCGASNLSVDNILERLLALPTSSSERTEKLKVTRIGHPARVMAHQGVLEATLEVKSQKSEQAVLAKDVKQEIDEALNLLSGGGAGKGKTKGKGIRGAERRKMWEDVRALRKEYRKREGGVVKSVLAESQVVVSTCHSSGGWQLRNHEFDVVIIDEATQALEAVCWIPIFKAKKLILAGDPMQLPPTILSSPDKSKKKREATGSSKPLTKETSSTPTTSATAPASPDSESESKDGDSSGSEEEEAQVLTSKKVKKEREAKLLPPKSLEVTLFDRLEKMYGPSIKRVLEIQYRMNATICDFPSKTLYHAKLKPHASVEKHLLADIVHPDIPIPAASANADGGGDAGHTDVDEEGSLKVPVVFFDTAGCEYFERLEGGDADEGSRCNENEATIVHNWVKTLIEAGVGPGQIAVITPYQAQVTLLTSLLRPAYGTELEIGTVDGMQGREKEAVIISLVRSNENREVGFLKEKRRLNVAMTRARRHLCVVGDSETVCHGGSYLKKWLAWLDANADVRYAGLE